MNPTFACHLYLFVGRFILSILFYKCFFFYAGHCLLQSIRNVHVILKLFISITFKVISFQDVLNLQTSRNEMPTPVRVVDLSRKINVVSNCGKTDVLLGSTLRLFAIAFHEVSLIFKIEVR